MSIGRDELKIHFKAGSLPTEEHFHGLIDSMLHMEDEGFRKTRELGLEISSAPKEDALLTFFRKEDAGTPLWSVRHGESGRALHVHHYQTGGRSQERRPQAQPALLSLHADGHLGVGQAQPRHRLHVGGWVASEGRTGTLPIKAELKANGQWHELVSELHGCQAFEVVVQAGIDGDTTRMALLHAHALNAGNPRPGGVLGWLDQHLKGWLDRNFNRRKRIRAQEAWAGQRCDRIELSWQPAINPKQAGAYALCVRTRCHYGAGGLLKASVTRLWPVPDANAETKVADADAGATP